MPADVRLTGTVTSPGRRSSSLEGTGIASELTARMEGASCKAVARSRIELDGTPSAPAPWFGASPSTPGPGRRLVGGFHRPRRGAGLPPGHRWHRGAADRLAVGERTGRTPHGAGPLPACQGLRSLGTGAAPDSAGRSRCVPRTVPPGTGGGEALTTFADGQLRKVVLARALDVVAERPFAVEAVMERIRALAGPAVVYRMLGRDGTSLVGASPEHLFVLADGLLETQALASTAAPEDVERLTGGRKEAREHAVVVESIRLALAPLSQRIEIGAAPEPLALGYVAHLRTPVRAQLRAGVTPADVVRALHPTAAVGGTPRAQALDFLRRHERLARGWYAGAIGWMGAEAVDLRVALRCALVRGATARLFSGAGAVTGSTADGEWHETALKARFMLRALRAEGG